MNNTKTKCMFCNGVDISTQCRDFYRDMMDKSTMNEGAMCEYALEGYCGIARDKGTDDFFLHFEFDAGTINGGIEISHCPKCGRSLKRRRRKV